MSQPGRECSRIIRTRLHTTERAVKNWFQAKKGPNGESLIKLCRHSDQVLETVLLLAGREGQVKVKRIEEASERSGCSAGATAPASGRNREIEKRRKEAVAGFLDSEAA